MLLIYTPWVVWNKKEFSLSVGGSTESVLNYNYVDSLMFRCYLHMVVPVALLVGIYVLFQNNNSKKGRYLFVAILSLIAISICMIEAFGLYRLITSEAAL